MGAFNKSLILEPDFKSNLPPLPISPTESILRKRDALSFWKQAIGSVSQESSEVMLDLCIYEKHIPLADFWNSNLFRVLTRERLKKLSDTKLSELKNNLFNPLVETALKSAIVLTARYDSAPGFPDFQTLVASVLLTANRASIRTNALTNEISRILQTLSEPELSTKAAEMISDTKKVTTRLAPHFKELTELTTAPIHIFEDFEDLITKAISNKLAAVIKEKSVVRRKTVVPDEQPINLKFQDVLNNPELLDSINLDRQNNFASTISRIFATKMLKNEDLQKSSNLFHKIAQLNVNHQAVINHFFNDGIFPHAFILGISYLLEMNDDQIETHCTKLGKNLNFKQKINEDTVIKAARSFKHLHHSEDQPEQNSFLKNKLTHILNCLNLQTIELDTDNWTSDV